MGSCVSQPAKVISKKSKGYFKTVIPKPDYELEVPGRKSILNRNLDVIANPTPGNFSEKYHFNGTELGRGEFGTTYRCYEIETEKAFACKIISKSKLRTEIDVEDVRREVQIMLHLPKHPNIVSFKDVFEDKEGVYIIMELCEGGELFDRIIAKGHYTERAAANVTKTIMEVCKVCHDHGVMHRDLKPENFLFADAGDNSQLKAIDFGLSTFFEPGEKFEEVVGSPYYMAPEVLRRNYGQQVDIWSAGVILYILLCGVPPFWSETEGGIAQAIIKGELDLERDPWPKISENAKDLVRSMLDPSPYTRPSVEEVLEHPWIKNRDKIRNVSLGDNVRQRIKQFYLMNKLKKKVLTVVADMLPEEQIDMMMETFNMMDIDGDGHLTFQELKDGLCKIGHPIPDHDVKMLMEAADADGTGTLDCEEFLAMSLHLERIACDDYLSQAFAYFDKDRSGYIEFEELKVALLDDKSGSNNDDQTIREIMSDVDLNKDDRISYEEFKAMMKTGMDWKMSSRQYSRAMLSELSMRLFSNKFSKK